MANPSPAGANALGISLLMLPETGPMLPCGLFEVLQAGGGAGAAPDLPLRLEPRLVARSRGVLASPHGVRLAVDRAIADDSEAQLIVVCDAELAPGVSPHGQWTPEIAWLRARFAAGATICSACSGALVLAEAGLLDGHEATSHWATAALFRDHYPQVLLRPERVLCDTAHGGRVVTAGGAASWQELALFLVARLCGAAEAARVARLFVIGDRAAGQLPFAAMAPPRTHADAAVARAQAWIAHHYAAADPVAGMTAASALHPRTFKRRFRQATGYAPIDYVQALRVERARELLQGPLPVEQVASRVGYAEPAHFSRLFRRLCGLPPGQWRRRFGAEGASW